MFELSTGPVFIDDVDDLDDVGDEIVLTLSLIESLIFDIALEVIESFEWSELLFCGFSGDPFDELTDGIEELVSDALLIGVLLWIVLWLFISLLGLNCDISAFLIDLLTA
ncbi:hypothetical protein D0502_05950 [Leuconostoc falkenbergense]|uniref:Uncharacterized protein n=1 Tax=Leuconostoc falkenbergense TaxID=2766470 RepID=A0A9X3E9N6_9LACO|nr:hypothetical protein [Leuconostoc falkenbergense]